MDCKFKDHLLLVLAFLIIPNLISAQTKPQLGAEIFLEPGQTPEQVDHWVKELSENKMPVARVFMMWNYLEPEPEVWDFTLYDALFKAAEKYDVKITATLVPNSPPFFWGEDFFYVTHNMLMFQKQEYREKSKVYIRKVVERYSKSTALDSWWLYNEPSGYPINDSFSIKEFQKWLKFKYLKIDSLNKSWQSYFVSFQDIHYDNRWMRGGWVWQNPFYDWNNFWREHVNNQIFWLANEVKKYDSVHPFHTNPPGVFGSLAHYDLPGMKKIINSLGSSLHPSWAFSFVPRIKYGLAVSWQNDLIYGVAEELPYWVSELQGGNNFNGQNPMGPSPKDIAQWVWTSIGSGAKRVIFWLLNARMQGNESNEWSLLDFHQQPSDRLKKAAEIANVMINNEKDFSVAKPIVSPITIVLSTQSLLMQERKQDKNTDIDAVNELAHQKASMACYDALMQQGIPVQIKLISEYDWKTKNKNQIVVIADAISLSMDDIKNIEQFVGNGNKVIATGLTGLFDENEKSWVVNREFPLKKVFGGDFKEIFMGSKNFQITLNAYKNPFPVQLWYTQIFAGTGSVLGMYNNKIIAVRNNYGKGNVLWFPSMIGLGAWTENIKPLSEFLKMETQNVVNDIPFHFNSFNENCFMHTLKIQNGFISIIVNGDTTSKKIRIISSKNLKSKLLYGKGWDSKLQSLSINAEETVVIKWE